MSMRLQNKILDAIEVYFDSVTSDTLQLAHRLTVIPDAVQERFWETVIAYIQNTAEREDVYTPMMRVYRDQARNIVEHL